MQVPVTVAANSTSALGVYVPLNQLQFDGAVANGFALYYSGGMNSSDGMSFPVRFSHVFRIPLSDSWQADSQLPSELLPQNWDFEAALQVVVNVVTQSTGAPSKAGNQTVDPATNTVAIALSANPRDVDTLVQVQSAIQAILHHKKTWQGVKIMDQETYTDAEIAKWESEASSPNVIDPFDEWIPSTGLWPTLFEMKVRLVRRVVTLLERKRVTTQRSELEGDRGRYCCNPSSILKHIIRPIYCR
jgi:hypothetical protein